MFYGWKMIFDCRTVLFNRLIRLGFEFWNCIRTFNYACTVKI